MKIFNLIQLRYEEFKNTASSYLSSVLTGFSTKNSNIFTQLINVLGSVTQNILAYIEDSLTEQNKYTATRKRSIYNLASLSGYNPSLGTATSMVIKVTPIPNNLTTSKLILPNHTKISCEENGMTYVVILPQESILIDLNSGETKYLSCVEGMFEEQLFVVNGGQLYTQNVVFTGDCDLDYLTVKVNNELYERVDSLYDMSPDGKQYVVRTSLKKGIDILFGNGQFGRTLQTGEVVQVEYLLHNGESGNIYLNNPVKLTIDGTLTSTIGEPIDTTDILNIKIESQDMIHSGTNSESMLQVKEMIGLNSRSLVLADPKNYKQFLSRFSFCGYNRTWSEPGSMVISSLILKNVRRTGKDYFALTEDDFILSQNQKDSIINHISNTGQQLAGTVFNIVDPRLVKYCMYVYIKMKNTTYDVDDTTNKIRNLVGEFFMDISNDYFIPKSDIIHLIKEKMSGVDSVDVYMLCEKNEKAIIDREYINEVFQFNSSTNMYDVKKEKIYLYEGENPNLGFDGHGNILLSNPNDVPVLMGGWQYLTNDKSKQTTMVLDPLVIIFE